eukprot:338457-Rhodomonas_salina.3
MRHACCCTAQSRIAMTAGKQMPGAHGWVVARGVAERDGEQGRVEARLHAARGRARVQGAHQHPRRECPAAAAGHRGLRDPTDVLGRVRAQGPDAVALVCNRRCCCRGCERRRGGGGGGDGAGGRGSVVVRARA